MTDGTTLLFGLPGFRVLTVTVGPDGGRQVLIESIDAEDGCPSCGVLSGRVKDRPVSRIKDLPHGAVALRVRVRKRRLVCAERLCERRSFTQSCAQLPTRSRLTSRLRVQVSGAVTSSNRAMSDVAAEHGLGWATVHRILVATAVSALGPPALTTMIGIDETRSRSVRWICTGSTWSRSNPWMTSFVDLDMSRPGGVIGLTPGRSGSSVTEWIALQSNEFRDGIGLVAIDPSAPYAAGIRAALPHARIAVDHFHLVLLANTMLTQVRQRAAREAHARRGISADPAWAHRRLLLRAGEQLSGKARIRLVAALEADDPTGEVGAAWAIKELLRQLLQAHGPTRYSRHETAHRRTRFLAACITADMPETTRLATTILKWWPEIETFLELGITNARTEGHNRVIKQIKRVACGFRNQANYERRIMLHSATTKAA